MSGYKELENEEGRQGFTRLEEKLRTQILRSGLPYSEIERRCGVSAPVISRFVARQRGLTSGSFCKLLELLEIEFAAYTPGGRLFVIEEDKELKGRRAGRLTQEQEDNMERNFNLRNRVRDQRRRSH
jgi:transcriptional regulator with XRE-family HTH domain